MGQHKRGWLANKGILSHFEWNVGSSEVNHGRSDQGITVSVIISL